MIATETLRELVEERLRDVPAPTFTYPLGYCTWGAEEILAALDCLCEQRTTMWTKCEAFEEQFAAYLGSKHAVMVNSGSSADLVAMLAAREMGLLERGDEVLVPAVTWPTQVWAAVEAGFNVRLVDVEPSTLNTTSDIYGAAITSKTRAIFAVHLMGNPCDMKALRELCDRRGLLLFEDCCEALGAAYDGRKVGTFGLAGTFSFFASHHISTMEGGMIATNSPEFADACRLLRAHGWARDLKEHHHDVEVLSRYGTPIDKRYLFLGMGFNFRPTELNAEIGRIQLSKLGTMNSHRAHNEKRVRELFRATNGHFIEGLSVNYKAEPAWFALPFILRENLPYTREQACEYLKTWGIDTRPIVGGNLMRHPAFWKYRDMAAGPLPGADVIHDRGFYVGLPPFETSMDSIIGTLNGMDSNLRFAQA